MSRSTSRVRAKFLAITTAAAALFAVTFFPPAGAIAADADHQPSAPLVALGMKFEGATGCNAVKCHGATKPNDPPKPAGNEFLTWSEGKAPIPPDKHSEAHKTLTKPESLKITQGMGIKEAPTETASCTGCHALVAPAALQMSKFNVKEGVTCNACHGPYEKWEKPHNAPGGADGLRKQANYAVLKAEDMPYSTASPEHQAMLKQFGLYDTRPILARAEKCTSCHLSIDAKMVAAGHPQPTFELAYYTELEPPHWREPGGYWGTKVWAAGQVVSLRDAMTQLANRAEGGAPADLVKAAYGQAMGHLAVFRPLTGGAAAAALDTASKDLKAAAADNAKLAAAARACAAAAAKMTAAVGAMKPVEGNTAAVLAKIAADNDLAKDAGVLGAQQQALAIASLFTSFVKGKGTVAGADDINKVIGDKLLAAVDPATFKAADYAAALKDVQAKLTPALPAGGAVAEPIDMK